MYHYTVHLESKPAALKACAGRKVLLSPALPATLPAPPRNRGPYRTPDSFSQTLERPLVLTQPYGSTVRPGARQLGRIPAVAPRRGWNICLRCSAAESCAAGAVQPRCARCPLSISDPFPGSQCRPRICHCVMWRYRPCDPTARPLRLGYRQQHLIRDPHSSARSLARNVVDFVRLPSVAQIRRGCN